MAAAAADTGTRSVKVMVGRSTVLDVGAAITRVSLTSPDVADAMVTSPNELLLNGKAPGTISMFVWDRTGGSRHYEITVQRDLSKLADQFTQLLPGRRRSRPRATARTSSCPARCRTRR